MKRTFLLHLIGLLLLLPGLAPAQQAGTWVAVVISQEDADQLGGWPLDRKYYSLAIESLLNAGAGPIYLDLAFPSPDLLHPESDAWFADLLKSSPSVHLVSPVFPIPDSVRILNLTSLHGNRFTAPFSLVFSPEYGGFSTDSASLSFSPAGIPVPSGRKVVVFPDPGARFSPLTLTSVLSDSLNLNGKPVFIYTNLNGISSFLEFPAAGTVAPTGELYFRMIQALGAGRFSLLLPAYWLLVFGLLSVSGGVILFRRRIRIPAAFLTGTLLSLLAGGLFLSGFFIPGWLLLPPLAFFLAGILFLILPGLRQDPVPQPSAQPEGREQDLSELTDLKYRLNFYENLSSAIPDDLSSRIVSEDGLVFHTASPLREVLKKSVKVAETSIPVMIFGESGTGKERVARLIHKNSPRAEKPFIAVNCGSFNENLIESELFGYEKGAFTGALQSKPGRFELADGGTLFLDEIGETSAGFQVKLLRVLQEGVFERVGGVTPIRVSVRIITATHQDLDQLIREKKFREDLFYRLNGFVLVIPPLRERPQDIEAIFAAFLKEKNPELNYSPALLQFLFRQDWKGNVRQLISSTERAVVNAGLRNRSFLIPEDFELPDPAKGQLDVADGKALQILDAFRSHQFKHRSISLVAAGLGLHRVTVTEYFRGWCIRFYNQAGTEEGTCRLLAGDPALASLDGLQSRVAEYLAGAAARADEALDAGWDADRFISEKFRNCPSVFAADLDVFYENRKKERSA